MKTKIKIITIIGAILAIVVSGITIYDRFTEDDGLTIEQRLSPDMMKALKDRDKTIRIEKGITIEQE